MQMTAKCILFDDTTKSVDLEEVDGTWTPSDVYDICEDKLGCRVKSVTNLEDLIVEVQHVSKCPEGI